MNDRFLFRGKRKSDGAWKVGSLKNLGTTDYCEIINDKGFCEVDPATIGQCTGLKDKNGKLIFEGDVLRKKIYNTAFGNPCREVFYMENNAQWDMPRGRNDLLDISEYEIIGNIHDNPELLEADK